MNTNNQENDQLANQAFKTFVNQNISESNKSATNMQQAATNSNRGSVQSEQRKNSSAPVLYLNKSQVLADSNIIISTEKLDKNSEKPIDLEANIVFTDSSSSIRSKTGQIVSNKLKNVGKIITDKFSSKMNKRQANTNETTADEDDDDDDSEMYEDNFYTKNLNNDYKLNTDKNNKINNAVLYEENDEETEEDNLIKHSDLETSYFIHNSNKEFDTGPLPLHDISQSSPLHEMKQPNEPEEKKSDDIMNKSNLLTPGDMTFSSSYASNNSNLNILKPSISIPNHHSQQQSTRVLKKAMTQGSKAMRIMGNDNKMSSTGESNNIKNSNNPNNIVNINNLNNNKKLQQKRLFFKNGNINISRSNIDKRRRRYLTDIFTTLIDLKWRYNLLVFALGFFVSWTAFATTWYFISYIHGDLEIINLQNKNYTACVNGITSFSGAILFSIETQQTIGYGVRYTTEKCPEAIFVMMIQSSVGVMIQSFMVGVVFAKLSRPKKRSETLMFSKNAVISLRDGRLCLICRVGDMRKSHIVEAHVRMYLIKKKVTQEGEIMPLHMYDLNVGWDKGLDRLFLVWPLTIEHYIDQNSPFWTLSADDLKKERFELAVILEGIVESTGMTTQARSSYLVNELLWGHRFEKLITFQKEDGTYKIDYSRFNMTVPVDTPTCSAKDLAELKEQEQFMSENFNENSNTPSTLNSKEIIQSDDNLNTNSPRDLRRRNNNTITNETESIAVPFISNEVAVTSLQQI